MIPRLLTWVRSRRQSARDDSGMTLTELLIASTLMIVLLTVVVITMSLFNKVTTSVSAQYQEINQGLPALAPLQTLLRAEVEPGPSASGVPVPGFGDFSSYAATINNYSLTFYSNIGTAYNNVTSAGTSAGPAKIVAAAYTSSGVPETNSSSCSTSSPCSFQVREFLPVVNAGVSTCPGVGTGTACSYPTNYTLITDAQNVVNSTPIFSYSIFDSTLDFAYTLTTSEVQNNSINLHADSVYNGSQYYYPSSTPNQYLSGTSTGTSSGVKSCVAPNSSYPTLAASCPADSIQSVGIDLVIGVKGASVTSATSSSQNTFDNQTIVYRYPESSGATTYPYQYSSTVG